MTTRRDVLESGIGAAIAAGFARGADPGEHAPADSERADSAAAGELEVLAEAQVDHAHACSHAKFDDRVPLDAGEGVADAPTVAETHTVWAVDHDAPGYVGFDAEAHFHDGPFVFYTFEGAVRPLVGTTVERAVVADEDCEELDEYTKVEPLDGEILLAAGERSVSFYADASGVVGEAGVEAAFADWQLGLLDTDGLRAVAGAYWLDGGNAARATPPR